jgi:hypothetical protein
VRRNSALSDAVVGIATGAAADAIVVPGTAGLITFVAATVLARGARTLEGR